MKKNYQKWHAIFFIPVVLIVFSGCGKKETYDLGVIHASILDVKSGQILKNKNIFIKDGLIKKIEENALFPCKETLDAGGRLISPGLIDTHIHPTDVFGDYERAPTFLPSDSLNTWRKKFSDQYLPYGTTTVITMGQPENWVNALLSWQKHPDPQYVDFILCGGALISKDNRTPYIAHTELTSPEKARKKLLEYHALGIRHIKLYHRLKEPEFSTVLKIADSLHMSVYGHIGDFNPDYLKIRYALEKGVINYEHIAVIPNSVLDNEDRALLNKQSNENYGEMQSVGDVMEFFLEQYRFVKEHKSKEMDDLIEALGKKKATLSTSIHLLYEQIAPTYFTQVKDSLATPAQLQRSKENFAIMMSYAKQMQDNGIELRLGSDMPDGGKVNISEMNILAGYGFSMIDIFKIATYQGAKALGIDNETGSVEENKKANLIIWDVDSLAVFRNFNQRKVIIKDGRIIKQHHY